MSLFPRREASGSWWRDHSLSLVLVAVLVAQTVWMVLAGHSEWLADQSAHGDPAAGWPWEFWRWWSYEYAASTVADTYGVLLVVLLTKWLYERGSAESNGD